MSRGMNCGDDWFCRQTSCTSSSTYISFHSTIGSSTLLFESRPKWHQWGAIMVEQVNPILGHHVYTIGIHYISDKYWFRMTIDQLSDDLWPDHRKLKSASSLIHLFVRFVTGKWIKIINVASCAIILFCFFYIMKCFSCLKGAMFKLLWIAHTPAWESLVEPLGYVLNKIWLLLLK